MTHRLLLILVVASLSAVACSGGDDEEREITPTGNTDAGTSADGGSSDAGTTGGDAGQTTEDAGGNSTDAGSTERCDLNVANPGEMNGTWELVSVPSQTKWFELRICHDLDDTNLDESNFEGDFIETSTGLTGSIQNPSYNEDPFSFGVNWFVNDNGDESEFNFSQGARVDENTLSGRFLNGRILETTDAQLRKVQ